MQEQEREIIAPASVPQELFINSDADITIASGSAGSSKSYSILLRWFRYVDCPHSRGVIFRRTSTQLTAQGGLWEEAQSLYRKVYGDKLKISIKHMKITFPSGASLQFSHYENEAAKEKFKGLQADYIAFDEMTEFTEEMVVYLRSRNRNASAERHHKACLVGATNPHNDSFLKDWVWWWLDPETVIKQTKQEFKANKDDMRAEINKIDILPIVMDTRWLDWFKDRGDIITLRDSKRNIGAYVYKPNNCVVTTGTSRAKAGKETYTTYEFVLDEICNGNTKALKEYFETKHNILFPNDKKKFLDISIPNKTYFKDIGYYYGGEIFDEEFQVLRSGELVVIASPTNLWKSTFTQKILERNKDKKSLYINFEFDLERWYEDSRKKKKWFQVKKKWTDLDPYTELELAEMRSYVEACKKKIEIQNLEQGEKLEKVVDLILQHIEKWYSLFAIDTFSSIEWADNWETQNLITRKLHEITKKTWACIIAVHHFNKTGAKMSWSQKISDLANVVLAIEYKDFWSKEWSVFSLLKDKGIYWIKTVECYFENWNYLSAKYL